jgi:hypothetical protein
MTKTGGTVVLSTNGILLMGLIAINLFITPQQPNEPPAPPDRIGAIVGQVELCRRETNQCAPTRFGETLIEGDRIRTGLFSEAVLHLHGNISVVIGPSSEFVIGQEVPQRSSFELGVGQITAGLGADSSLEIQFISHGSDAVASARSGEFSLSTDGQGTVQVNAFKGDVVLAAQGSEVVVKPGTHSTVLPKQPPSPVMPIPTSVALQVKWPPTKSDLKSATITGTVPPASTVLINGIMVRARPNGSFSAEVPLQEGSNRLVINATDLAGNTTTRESPEILVDTKPPKLDVNAEGLWR